MKNGVATSKLEPASTQGRSCCQDSAKPRPDKILGQNRLQILARSSRTLTASGIILQRRSLGAMLCAACCPFLVAGGSISGVCRPQVRQTPSGSAGRPVAGPRPAASGWRNQAGFARTPVGVPVRCASSPRNDRRGPLKPRPTAAAPSAPHGAACSHAVRGS